MLGALPAPTAAETAPAWRAGTILAGDLIPGHGALVVRAGTFHAAARGRAGGAWYGLCSGICLTPADWRFTPILPPSTVVHEVALAVDARGFPRALAWTNRGIMLLQCQSRCAERPWSGVVLEQPGAVPAERRRVALSVDPNFTSHVAFLHADGKARYGQCPDMCALSHYRQSALAPNSPGKSAAVVGLSLTLEGYSPRLVLVVAGVSPLHQIYLMACGSVCATTNWAGFPIRADFAQIVDPHLVVSKGAHRLVFAFDRGIAYAGCERACGSPQSWASAVAIADERFAAQRPQIGITSHGALRISASAYTSQYGYAASLSGCNTLCQGPEFWGTERIRPPGAGQLALPALALEGTQPRLLLADPGRGLVFVRCDAACGTR